MPSPLRFQFPPDNPADAGPTYRSRLYERFADLLPVVTYSVMLWCVVVFLLLNKDQVGNAAYELAHMLGLTTRQDLAEGRWWGLIAAACIHFNLWHIAFNMLWLFKLGSLMERGVGSLKTLAFFIAAAFVSSTLQLFIGGPGIGFSGVVYALAGFMWGAWPRYTGFLEGFSASTLRWLLIWQAICFLLSCGRHDAHRQYRSHFRHGIRVPRRSMGLQGHQTRLVLAGRKSGHAAGQHRLWCWYQHYRSNSLQLAFRSIILLSAVDSR